mgnify:CR=1 FL=1
MENDIPTVEIGLEGYSDEEMDAAALSRQEAAEKQEEYRKNFELEQQQAKENNEILATQEAEQKEKDKKKGKGLSLFGKKKAKVEDVLIFSKQFATMVKAGLPILNVLTMLRDQIEHPTMKEIIEDVRKNLEGGITLSTCFAKYPKIFDSVYINLIKAGEASGKLDTFLLKLVVSAAS